MEGITKILAPTDFSEPSRRALDYALFLARAFDAELEVLHVLEAPVLLGPDARVQVGDESAVLLSQFLEKQAREALETLKSQLAREERVRVTTRLERGNPAQVIVRTAKDGGHDLVVMGTHGRTGLSHLFAGSVAERVVRLAPCPVLTTRPNDADAELDA